MKLSIVILCWNDRNVIAECLQSIYGTTHATEFEVIVSDNGSTDGSIDLIRTNYPQVQVIENGCNLRFAKANNVGVKASRGDYVLILNPDTVIHEGALDAMVRIADLHPQIGAFGCRVLNSDGSYQVSARPFASLRGEWIVALYLRWLSYVSERLRADAYPGWKGETPRQVDWITGCFMLIRADVFREVGGFDEQFFYYYEDMDLCRQIRAAGYQVAYVPDASITHLKGQSTNLRLPPVTFALDRQITRFRYYYKYYGRRGVRRARRIALVSLLGRRLGYGLIQLMMPSEAGRSRLEVFRTLLQWNYHVDPVRLVENGEEPSLNLAAVGRVLER